ncbi:MAG TPA: hypothetical protein VHV10_08385, partial [Ktedonobacteraceae bacterium]|nr:hypothetical protein [Ktedonobacteraceae bacterium]
MYECIHHHPDPAFGYQILCTRYIWSSDLTSSLSECFKYPLTLISAPAGFGKTTLLSSWTQSLPAPTPVVAWVSLDEENNDPRLFWTYALAALDLQRPERFTPLLKYV